MEAKNGKVFQVTYIEDGRMVLVGNEMMNLGTAAKSLYCPEGHQLIDCYQKVENTDQVWWLKCRECGLVRFVTRYDRVMDRDGGVRLAKRGAGVKASEEIMRKYGHHPKPWESLDEAYDALTKEELAMEGTQDGRDN